MRAWVGASLGFLLIAVVFPVGHVGAADPARLTPSLAARHEAAAASDWLDVIVNFGSWDAKDTRSLRALDAVVVHELFSIPTVFAYVRADRLLAVAGLPGVDLVENNERIEYDMDTAVVAGNVTPLWGTKEVTLNGTVIDGKGVTIAVVDTGVNAGHDDIKHRSKTVRNMMALGVPAEPPTTPSDPMDGMVLRWEDVENSDGGGHGSHVAGIVAGDGTLSGGKYKGSAPGANLVGLGSQLASFWYAVGAWDWVFQNHKAVTPNIRIITNSWGYATGQPCNPDISLTKVQKRLVLDANIVMFFSAGNTGSAATGASDSTRTQFKCPWEGNIGVANYFDENRGTRDGYMSNSTSKGKKADPSTWPDIAAPGTQILATNGYPLSNGAASYLVGCFVPRLAAQPAAACYRSLSGTSMSTPYAAGVGALLLQVRPDLKPADVEYILEATAYKVKNRFDAADDYYVDASLDYRHHGSHFVRGHGLIDAAAAVQLALTYDGAKTPVVYGEKETPNALSPPGKLKKANPGAETTETPGFALWLVVSAAVAVAALRRRSA